jgi:hypothetical protein
MLEASLHRRVTWWVAGCRAPPVHFKLELPEDAIIIDGAKLRVGCDFPFCAAPHHDSLTLPAAKS